MSETGLEIIFEDNYLLVVNKPAGIPSEGKADSAEHWATDYLKKEAAHRRKPFLLHRLDKPVSGLLLFAKTAQANKFIQTQFEERSVRKFYLAILEGTIKKKEGVLSDVILKDPLTFLARRADKNEKGAKEAKLSYELLEVRDNLSLAKIELFTGRYHQIRLQMSLVGYPVLGDLRYGAKAGLSNEFIGLHAYCLEFRHPKTDVNMKFMVRPKGDIWNGWDWFETESER
jgi:23S rRNA pseudouridine1911/1915/1917 synthase